jgi:WD40 repeat protein
MVYDLDQGNFHSQMLEAHSLNIEQITFSPDGTRIGTASQDRTAKIWTYSDGQVEPNPLVLAGHNAEVGGITFIGDGSQVATGVFSSFPERTVRIWDVTPRNGIEFGLDAHDSGIWAIDFNQDGRHFATASFDGTAIIWDMLTEQPVVTLAGHTGVVLDIAFSPDGALVATASEDKTAVIWDAATGEPLHALIGHGDGIVGNVFEGVVEVSFSPDGTRLATAGADQTARVWDVNTGQELMVLDNFATGLLNVVFSPDGKYIATASDATGSDGPEDGSIKIWDADSGQELFLLPPSHRSRPIGLEFSPDGSMLVTSGSDTTAKIWLLDLESRRG